MTPSTISLPKAKESFLTGAPPAKGGEWVADLSFDETRQLIGQSFSGTETVAGEPKVEWMFEMFPYIPHEVKQETVTFFMSFPLNEDMAKHGVTFARRTKEGDLAAAVVVVESHPHEGNGWMTKALDKIRDFRLVVGLLFQGKMPILYTDEKYKKESKLLTKQADHYVQQILKWHRELGPQHKHWYVNLVATHPSQQGKGIGSEMMRRVTELADEQEMDCFLGAGNEKNRRFYEKFGFELVEHNTISNVADPAARPCDVYLMTRKARAQSLAQKMTCRRSTK